MEILAGIKTLLFGSQATKGNKESACIEKPKTSLIDLTVYEVRRQELEESTDSIEGIFYIFRDEIILDCVSECLRSDKDNIRRDKMYHDKFYSAYMRKKFEGLPLNEKAIPRGRVTADMIYVDLCYSDDLDTLAKIKTLYRLPEKIRIIQGKSYSCPNCQHIAATLLV